MSTIAVPITSLSAALLTGLMLYMSLKIIGVRRGKQISLGTGGDPAMERLQSGQRNLIEYSGFALILLFLAEVQGLFWPLLALAAAAIVIGRGLHAAAFIRRPMNMKHRVLGMHLTLWPMVGLSVAVAILAIIPG